MGLDHRELGRELGFPTANLTVPPGKVSFATGVYAGWARPGADWLPAVANLGYAPTVSDGGDLRLEVHLLHGDHDLYGHRLELVANTQTQEQIDELKRVAPDMLEEWSRTKKAPRHAAWLHELEFTGNK